MLLPPGWLPAGDRVRTRRAVFDVPGFLWSSGAAPCAGVRCQGVVRARCPPPPYSWGWVRLHSRQVTPGVPGSLWPRGVVVGVIVPPFWMHALVGGSVACRPSMVPVRPLSVWRPQHAVGVVWRRVWGGAEVDGPEDVKDVAVDGARARRFVALAAVVARDQGGGVVMVAVLREEEDEPSGRVPLAIILATAALPYVPDCGGWTHGCLARCASGWRLRGRGIAPPREVGNHQPLGRPRGHGPAAVKEFPPLAAMGAADDAYRPFRVCQQLAEGEREAGGEGDDGGAVVVVVHGGDGAPTVWQIANGG